MVCRSICEEETHVNFLTDPNERRLTFRPTDVLVFGWVEGKHARVNLIEIYPLVDLRTIGFNVGYATFKAVSSKVAKHEKTFSDNQHALISFDIHF